MEIQILGMAIFFGMHVMTTLPPLKKGFTRLVGKKGYLPIYAILSAVGLTLMLMGYGDKPLLFIPEWSAPSWARQLAMPLILVSLILLTAAYIPSNVKRITRHPMLWGVSIWAGLHLWLNGDKASILLFGGFLAYSLWAMFSANLRGAKKQSKKVSVKNDIAVVVIGGLAFAALVYWHKQVAGVALF